MSERERERERVRVRVRAFHLFVRPSVSQCLSPGGAYVRLRMRALMRPSVRG